MTFKKSFRTAYKQVHFSATSCKIGFQNEYHNRYNLTGGMAIVTTDQWVSKVCYTQQDPRGHGTYTITTLQGRNSRKISIIAAYISVEKGTYAGINTVHAQQKFIMEQQALKESTILPAIICPRKEAIKALGEIIGKLQEDNHAIILTIDANQTPQESLTRNGLKKYSIEWLRQEYGMQDPFVELCSTRPPTTTIHPNRDIDYVLT